MEKGRHARPFLLRRLDAAGRAAETFHAASKRGGRMNVSSIVAAAALAALPLYANAQDARSLAATCAACHGTNGHSVSTEVTSLAGLSKDLIVQRMQEFKSGKRPATVMHQLAKGYTDPQIELIAGYLAGRNK
jgi:cytochrome subunit of sulfide dehydrogenase